MQQTPLNAEGILNVCYFRQKNTLNLPLITVWIAYRSQSVSDKKKLFRIIFCFPYQNEF